jgi:hypothetical protein
MNGFPQAYTAVIDWIHAHRGLVWSLGGLSVVVFLGTLMMVPILIARLPSDYFAARSRTARSRPPAHPVFRWMGLLIKNGLGVVLLAAGLAMLVLPGQGILTMFVGVLLLDFPGKYRLEKWIISRPMVRRPVDWIRARGGRAPLELG